MNKITNFENYSGTIFDKKESYRNKKTIFVSIPCYRDSNVINTIYSMILNAKRPENIYISVSLSEIINHQKWFFDLEEISKNHPNVIVKVNEISEVNKMGELRKISDSSYNKEDYYLQISSSSEFDPHWDDILIKQYEDIIENRPNEKVVLTSYPRGYLNHEEVIDGYVYYTNHKTKNSIQREDYDGSRIPVCGFNEFVSKKYIESQVNEKYQEYFINDSIKDEVTESLKNELFLEKNGFPKFSNRVFRNNEFIASSLGITSKFIFSSAKNYLRDNPAVPDCIDFEDSDFISFITLLNKKYSILSIRLTPIYHLYEGEHLLSKIRKSPKDFYENKNISESISYKKCREMIESLNELSPEEKFKIDNMLSIDWESKKFKIREKQIDDVLVRCINSFISMYNFSINENSLHWNKSGF